MKLIFLLTLLFSNLALADNSLLNVSYDVTREFYKDFNQAFVKYWQKAHFADGGVFDQIYQK